MKKKVLFVSPLSDYAGPDVTFEQLLVGINREEIEPIVVIPKGSYIRKTLVNKGIKIYPYNFSWWFPIETSNINHIFLDKQFVDEIKYINNVIKIESIDLVFSNTTVFLSPAISAAINQIPHILHMHALFQENIYRNIGEEFKYVLYKIFGMLSNVIVVPSNELAEYIKLLLPQTRIEVINNGVDGNKFYPATSTEKPGNQYIVSVGHINDNKNQLLLIEAMRLINNLENNIKLWLIGPADPDYLRRVKTLIKQYKLENKIIIDDFRHDIPDILRKGFIFANVSKTETFPVSIVEAQASGLPVVATITGSKEIIIDKKSGYLIRDAQDIAEKVIKLIKDKKVYIKMKNAARKNFESSFSISKYQDAFIKIINETYHENSLVNEKGISILNLLFNFPKSDAILKKKKILVLSMPSATTNIVIKTPFDILQNKNIIEYDTIAPWECDLDRINEYDIIICLRFFDENSIKSLKKARELRIPFIFITDDNYFELTMNIQGDTTKVNHEKTENSNLLYMIINSDAIVVFSSEMMKNYEKYNGNIFLLPNYQEIGIDIKKPRNQKIIIGYMGTLFKDKDFEFLIPAINKVLDEFKDIVSFEFIGFIPDILKGKKSIRHFEFINDYDEFREFFSKRNWDIGLAPLADTQFNRSKTNNKFREYSSLGIAGIYSNIVTYNEWIQNNDTGLLLDNTEDDWYKGMKTLIINSQLREHIGQNALNYIKKNMTIDYYINAISSVLLIIESKTSLNELGSRKSLSYYINKFKYYGFSKSVKIARKKIIQRVFKSTGITNISKENN